MTPPKLQSLPERSSVSNRQAFLLRVAELLHVYGTPAFRLERVLMPVSREPSAARARGLVDGLAALSDAHTWVREIVIGDEQPPPFRTGPPPEGMSVDKERLPEQPIVEAILDQVHTMSPELLVLTSRGHDGPLDALFGSTAEQVLRRAGVPVLIVPAD